MENVRRTHLSRPLYPILGELGFGKFQKNYARIFSSNRSTSIYRSTIDWMRSIFS